MRIFSWGYTGAQPENFQDRDVFSEYGHFDKRLFYGIPKNFPAVGNLFFFCPSTLKIAFLNDNLNHRRTRTGHFVCKIWALFSVFKKGQGRPTPTPQPQYVSRLYTHEKILYAKKLKFET